MNSTTVTSDGEIITKSHKTKLIPIKTSYIDVKIVPVINWLNGFDEIYTRWCCQGDDDLKNKPYIIFYCESQMILTQVASKIKHYADIILEYYESANTIRYEIRFHDCKSLDLFIEQI